MMRLYQRDSGEIISVRLDETFEVVLDGDPSTDLEAMDRVLAVVKSGEVAHSAN